MAVEVVDGGGVPGRRVLRRVVADAVAGPPGPELMARLLSVGAQGELSAREWVEVAAAWKTLVSFATAGMYAAIGHLDQHLTGDPTAPARPGRACPVRPTADEIAPALGMAPRAASTLVALVRRVEGTLPAAVDALAEGRLDAAQLRALDQVTRDLPAPARRQVEALAVRRGPYRTAQQLREDLENEAHRLAPGHAAAPAERGVAERDVVLRPSPLPGCRRLVADLPTLAATSVWLAVNGAARTAKNAGQRPDGTAEDRSLPLGAPPARGGLRADLTAALLTGQTEPDTAQPGTLRVPTPVELAALAEVHVVVSADSLAGASDAGGSVPGIGPVDAPTVRAAAERAPWRRLVADPPPPGSSRTPTPACCPRRPPTG